MRIVVSSMTWSSCRLAVLSSRRRPVAPPQTRELRGWVRHRAKLVGLRSSLKNQVHAVLGAAGLQVRMSDAVIGGGALCGRSRSRSA